MENNHAIKFGAFAGFGTILFLFLFYWIEKELMLSPGIIWSTMLLYILGMYMAPLEVRKEKEGYISFKSALKPAFLVFVIANSIYHLYNYALYNFLDSEMLSIQQKYMLENMNVLDNMLSEEQMEAFEDGVDGLNYNFSTVITTYFSSLLGGFFLAAIIARTIRREPPLMDNG